MKRRDFVRTVAAAGASAVLPLGEPVSAWAARPGGRTIRLDTGWRFRREDVAGAERPGLDDAAWEPATLPHTARVEALVTGEPGSPTYQWQGICWYRRALHLGEEAAGKKVWLHFEAAMNVAEVFLDGEEVGRHMGGFLPFVVDLTGRVVPGREHELAVRLDNRDNPVTGPKPLEQLDFNTYGGLYRYVWLVIKDSLHITDPLFVDRPAGGGVLVTCPRVSAEAATVRVQTHVRYDARVDARTFRVRTTLLDADGGVVARSESEPVTLGWDEDTHVVQELEVLSPRLWSPRSPHLYTVRTEVVSGGAVVDAEETRVGIRWIHFDGGGFAINGERTWLRGTNRHQEHPYVGYAVPAAAQWRDAKRIKDAGFDYVRLSHYPHSPAFMDACDELGLVVMDCIPGWQYFGEDPAFAELQYQNVRDLARRDRNHPCVVLWEVSLNETAMPIDFIARTHAIAHEEHPGVMYTCGWMHGYDVFIRARQHGGCRGEDIGEEPCLVSEYGDWEYYAMTAGLDQDAFEGLTPAESNSRQLRWQGERAMLQQALNFQEAHNDNRGSKALGDGLWVMFDYNRGYAPDIESSGCMDIMRLPKYSHWFYRSQRLADERLAQADSGPMVFIASEWTPESSTRVRVFGNCRTVELRLNGETIEERYGDRDFRYDTHLGHSPFTFEVGRFVPGTLEALGRLDGGREVVARHVVRTPGAVERMDLAVDLRGRPVDGAGKDVLFCHAALRDAAGTVVASAWENVAFGATGGVRLVGANPFSTDAGIASILAETEPGAAPGALYALAVVGARVLVASAPLTGPATAYEVRRTAGGAELVVDGRVVASLDERTPKFRVPPSAPPEKRDPFRHG